MTDEIEIRGVIGLSLFEDCLVTFDYPRQELGLELGTLAASADSDVIQYDARGPLPEITLVVGNRTIPAHVDSGASSAFTLPKSFALEIGVEAQPRVVGRGRTINGEFDVWAARLSGSIRLGGHEYRSPEVRLNDRFLVANVGHAVLRDFAVTVDQTHHRMRFKFDEKLDDSFGAVVCHPR